MSHRAGSPTVLLIDDDPETRDLLAWGLRDAGFVVFTARGEGDGADLARAAAPGVILLEFGRLHTSRSLEAGRHVRAAAGLRAEVPLVVYAGGEDGVAREGESVEVAHGEYVVLPDDHYDLAAFLLGLMATPPR